MTRVASKQSSLEKELRVNVERPDSTILPPQQPRTKTNSVEEKPQPVNQTLILVNMLANECLALHAGVQTA